MKQIIPILGLIGLISYTRPQLIIHTPDQSHHSWDSTKNWKLYKLQNFNGVFRIPADSLQYLERKALNDDTLHVFLSQSSKLGPANPVWMGCYLASYEDATGNTRKAIISHYGGFFYCQAENMYFQVNSENQADWLNYFAQSYLSIP